MKKLIVPFLTLIALLNFSCDTEIPETDTIAPEFIFKISGDGFDHSFTQDDDFNSFQLNLKTDTEYDFVYSSSDQGGVRLIQWQVPYDRLIIFQTEISSPWTIRDIVSLTRMIEWYGNYNNPTTGNIISGTFKTNGDNVFESFRFFVSDFGGASSNYNNTSGRLNFNIRQHNTEIIEF